MRAWCSKAFLGIACTASLLSVHSVRGAQHARSRTASTLISRPAEAVARLSVAALSTLLRKNFQSQPQLRSWIGEPVCGVSVHKFVYATIGGRGEATDASGALMVPTGTTAQCRGPRPMVLYTHGTEIDRSQDMSAIADPANPARGTAIGVALVFGAQGYIVVAPNYAGYDVSKLTYHPYLNRIQQSQDAIDSLTAGRQLLRQIGGSVSDGGRLFVTGYSQGGFVSMATLQALDEQSRPATAGAPLSGPYALLAMGDEVFLGHADFGGTAYLPLVVNSYAHLEHRSIEPGQVLSAPFRGAATLFPGKIGYDGFDKLISAGAIPASALFQSESAGAGAPGFSARQYPALAALPPRAPLYKAGFDPSRYLVSTAFRAAYVADIDANPDTDAPADGSAPRLATIVPTMPGHPRSLLRQDLKANDLRNYTPSMPLLMCGGYGDPEVFWDQGAGAMTAVLQSKVAADPGLRFAALDLDISAGTTGTYVEHGLTRSRDAALRSIATRLQAAFTAFQHAVVTSRGAQVGMEAYHVDAVPYCMVAARSFFDQY